MPDINVKRSLETQHPYITGQPQFHDAPSHYAITMLRNQPSLPKSFRGSHQRIIRQATTLGSWKTTGANIVIVLSDTTVGVFALNTIKAITTNGAAIREIRMLQGFFGGNSLGGIILQHTGEQIESISSRRANTRTGRVSAILETILVPALQICSAVVVWWLSVEDH